MRFPDAFEPLRERQFRLLFGSRSVSSFGGTMAEVAQVLYGGANAFGRPAYTGLIPQTVSVGRLQQANALMGLSFSTVGIAGPAVGAVIVASANPGWALAVDAATFAASVALLLRIALPPTLRVAGGSVLADFRDGWAEFVARPWVVAMVVWFGLFQLATFPALLVLGPYVAKHELGGAGEWGAILAVEAVGSLIGGLLALRVRFRRPLAAMLVLGLPTAALLLVLGLAPPVWAISCVSFANGASLSLGGAVWFSTLQEKVLEHAHLSDQLVRLVRLARVEPDRLRGRRSPLRGRRRPRRALRRRRAQPGIDARRAGASRRPGAAGGAGARRRRPGVRPRLIRPSAGCRA